MARQSIKVAPLWSVAVITAPEAEEAVAALLEREFHEPPVAYEDADTRVTTVTAYSRAPVSAALRQHLGRALQELRACQIETGELTLSIAKVKREDWSESWKKHFQPIEIGRSLLIRPSWSPLRAQKGQAVLVLDPGLSFGTGQHATTSFCLRELVQAREKGRKQSFLDVGTGSGILALAAAKLGFSPVRAFDFDAVAVRIARENARRNRVEPRLSITRQDLTRLPVASRLRYDCVCANLIDDLLIQEKQRLVNRLKPDGLLVLAGILRDQFQRVKLAYEALGLELRHSHAEAEWQSGAFRFKAAPRQTQA